MVRRMTNRWIASYEMSDRSEYLEHTGRLGMKWYQHIFGKDPAKGQKIIERKRKALSANVALAKDAARRGNAKRLAQLNKKTKKMIADVKQLEDQYESSTGKKYSSSKPGEAEDAVAQTKQTSKETILKTGSAKDVFAIKDQLTQSELQDAINRIQKENTLAGLKASEVQQKIDNAKNFTNTIINAGNTAVNAFNAYENVAKMVNTISGEDTLPVFTGRKEKASKEAEKARAKKVKAITESTDAQKIADNIHLFTNAEVLEAKKRLDNYSNIKKQAAANAKEKSDEAAKKIAEAAKEAKKKAEREAAIKEANTKKFNSYLSEWDDYIKSEKEASKSTMDIVEEALKEYNRATRGKPKPTAETYGLDKLITPSFEDKAAKWIESFTKSEDKEIADATKELEKAFKALAR